MVSKVLSMIYGNVFIGVVNDYYVAVGLIYLGVSDFPSKKFFWCSSANWIFAELPEPLHHLGYIFDNV